MPASRRMGPARLHVPPHSPPFNTLMNCAGAMEAAISRVNLPVVFRRFTEKTTQKKKKKSRAMCVRAAQCTKKNKKIPKHKNKNY